MADAGFLKTVGLFSDLKRQSIDYILGLMMPVRLQGGQDVFSEGQAEPAMYVVVSGELVVSKKMPDGREKILAALGPGEFFGEMSLYDGLGHSARVTARTDAELLCLDESGFKKLEEEKPRIANRIARKIITVISRRLRGANDQIVNFLSWSLQMKKENGA